MTEDIEAMIPIDSLIDHYKTAQLIAKQSPCVRRQYGAVIVYEGYESYSDMACNYRVSNVCDHACVRDRAGLINGSYTEYGAEVHAEQAVLIESAGLGRAFILAGWQKGVELRGENVFPCLTCARMIKYAGYKYVYMMGTDTLQPYHINDIIKYREDQIGPHYE